MSRTSLASMVEQEQKILYGRDGSVAEWSARDGVSRAGNLGYRLGLAAGGPTVANVLAYMRTQLASPRAVSELEVGMPVRQPVSGVWRRRYGWGSHPDALLHGMIATVSQILPEHADIEVPYTLAGRVIDVVSEDPTIQPGALRDQLSQRHPEGVYGVKALSVAEAVILDGVVTATHYLSSNFFAPEVANMEALK